MREGCMVQEEENEDRRSVRCRRRVRREGRWRELRQSKEQEQKL